LEQKPRQKLRKTFAFSLRPELVEKFNKKIGYGSRSEVVEELISQYVKGGGK